MNSLLPSDGDIDLQDLWEDRPPPPIPPRKSFQKRLDLLQMGKALPRPINQRNREVECVERSQVTKMVLVVAGPLTLCASINDQLR
jgi:hypothetical protein